MKLLITGRSGSGKTTVCNELKQLGLPAFDTDKIPGLVQWVDADTHQPVTVDTGQPIDRAATLWWWNEAMLRDLVSVYDGLIFCGSADNDLSVMDAFDKVFVLTVSPEVQRQRILSRTEHDYGKSPEMQQRILAEQQEFVPKAIAQGALSVNAEQPPLAVVQDIVKLAYGS